MWGQLPFIKPYKIIRKKDSSMENSRVERRKERIKEKHIKWRFYIVITGVYLIIDKLLVMIHRQ
jgi:hypothetical protein